MGSRRMLGQPGRFSADNLSPASTRTKLALPIFDKGVNNMVITFILWTLLNVLDIVISMVAIGLGAGDAGEVGFLAGIGSFSGVVIVKMILVVIVGATLSRKKEENLLAALSLGMVGICIYNGCVVIKVLEIIKETTGL